MSESEDSRTDVTGPEALTRLEAAVGRLIDRCEELSARVDRAEARGRDLEALLKKFKKGKMDPAQLQALVSGLQSETDDLKSRLSEGRDGVDRLLSQLRFLEER